MTGLNDIIDVHSHSMLRSWYRFLAERSAPVKPLIEGVAIPDWSPEQAIETMDENGISAMVLSNPIGTKDMGRQDAICLARRMNDELADVLTRYPRRFGAFGALPLQDIDAALAELEYAIDTLGFDGVCLQTSFDGAYPGDPRFEPIIAALDARGATAFVHPASSSYMGDINLPVIAGLLEYPFETTRALTSLILSGTRRRYRNFRYISTHAGGTLPFLANRIAFVVGRRGTGFAKQLSVEEITEDLQTIHFDLAISYSRAQLLALREVVQVERILLGFDYPMAAAQTIRHSVEALQHAEVFGETELKLISRENALKILPQLASRLCP